MFNSECELDLFQRVIQKLTFTPSIKLYDLLQSGIEIDIGRDNFDKILLTPKEPSNYTLSVEMSKSRNRYKHILSRLTVENTNEESPRKLLPYPKIYSDTLNERQVILYNSMAERIGFSKITHILPAHMMKEICLLDGINLNEESDNTKTVNNFIYKHYPYFFAGEFKGVTFTEYILLLNIYQQTKNRSLFILNTPPKYSKDIRRNERWKNAIITNISTPKIYKVYIDTFLKVFFDTVLDDYNKKSEDCYQLVWSPEEYKKSKIIAKEVKRLENIEGIPTAELYNLREQLFAPDLLADIDYLRPLLFQTLPNVWKTLLLKYDQKIEKKRKMEFGYNNVDDCEKKEVVKYCRFIEEYIAHSIKDATLILNKFFG